MPRWALPPQGAQPGYAPWDRAKLVGISSTSSAPTTSHHEAAAGRCEKKRARVRMGTPLRVALYHTHYVRTA